MTDEVRDSDVLAADHQRSREERGADHKADVRFTNLGSRRRRTIYLSEEVYRDGEPVRIEEVLVVDDDEPHPDDIAGAEPVERDPFWSPDRRTDPYRWEQFWRGIMRHDLRAGRWRGTTAWERVTWYCERCRKPIADVKSRGREPKWCSDACRQAAYRERQAVTK